MEKIHFIKMHGLGNDFVIIDNRIKNIQITKDIIAKLSDRKRGAGCDQLITINRSSSDNYDAYIKIYNADGDTAEACGNGTRCVAKLLFDENTNVEAKIKSDAGILLAKKIDDLNISINLGKPSTNWKDIPLAKEVDTLNVPLEIKSNSYNTNELNFCVLHKAVAINIGNPHVVFFGKNIGACDLDNFGPTIENHKLFPEKTNVELVEIIDRKTIKMRVWERGVGITLACGSGACAAAYAGKLLKLLDDKVEVQLKLGSLYIALKNNEVILTGPAEISFRGSIEI